MIKGKTYRYDDEFKAKARAHQFEFREKELKDFYNEKNPQVILSPCASTEGLIFCDTYRDLIKSKVKKFGTSALFSNMLRSEHIPYNIFVPMEEDLNCAALMFNEIIGGGIAYIKQIYIEFAGYADKKEYLDDKTSFDTFIEYVSLDGSKGGIGIEVKYTENGYPIGVKEKADIENASGLYHQMTIFSHYYADILDVSLFLKAHHLRQIWRNHILGYSMINRGDIQRFHHIHLYPEGNKHFHDHALPEYRNLLTEAGEDSFVELTFEKLFAFLHKYFTTSKHLEWQEYLHKRYIVQ